MKLNKALRSALSKALAAVMVLSVLTPTAIFAAPEAEAVPLAEAAAEAVSDEDADEEALEADLAALPREELADHAVSYTAFTDTVSFAGQKLTGVFVQYDDNVQARTLRTSTYDVQAFKGDNKTLASAQITAVYSNSEPAFREDKTSVEGPYVIIELSDYDGVGTMDLSNVYVTDADGKEYSTGGYGNIESVDPVVIQKNQIALTDVLVKAGTIDAAKANKTINKNFDDFEDLVLDSRFNTYGDAKIRVKYHLPEGYDAEGKELYPLVVVQCGGGLRMREITNEAGEVIYRSYGANIAFDTSVTSWMDDEYKAKGYKDVIVISVDNRCINDNAGDPYNRYVAADDINQTVEYFLDNFKVDPSSVIYSGNSQGSLIGYQTVSSRPELWTAFMACNGLAITSPDPFSSDENMAKYMEGVANVMDAITDNHIAMYWNLGETDMGASGPRGQLFYDYAKARYEAQGMTQEQIDEILHLTVFADEEYLHYGIINADGSAYAHGATKLAYTAHKDEFQPWLLGQVKTPAEMRPAASVADDVYKIQAITGANFYGAGVDAVVIYFRPDVDITGLTKEDFVLVDRGSLNPDFGEVPIKEAVIDEEDNIVVLHIDTTKSAATETNAKVYTNPGSTGSRSRNAFGIYCTGAWYRDVDGVLHYGKEDTDEYKANTTGQGYQVRETLELKLRLAGEEDFTDSECLATDLGKYNPNGLWMASYDEMTGPDGFKNLYDLQIPSTGADIPDGTADQYVRGYYYVPENYDPANGIVVYLQGQGVSYWQDQDGTNNEGCGFLYDTNTWAWKDSGAIVVNIQDRSTTGFGLGEVEPHYDFVVDDANVMKYFIDKYGVTGNIVVQGNSRGTMACDILIKALAGAPYNPAQQGAGFFANEENGGYNKTLDKSVYDFEVNTYVCQNGPFGGHSGDGDDMFHDDSVWEMVAKTGLRVWCFDGEQDMHENIHNIAKYRAVCKELGYNDEWIKDNIRLTGYTTELFYPWGETDHSVTRINGWYFSDQAYYGPDLTVDPATGEIKYKTMFNDGDTYELVGYGRAAENAKKGYKYTVYDDIYTAWALRNADVNKTSIVNDVVSFQAVTDVTFYGLALTKVIITFKDGVDVSGLTVDDFVVVDRGSLKPDFGEVDFSDIKIEGQKVTLIVSTRTGATENNKRIYSGATKEGSRERNVNGVYVTGAWYRDANTHTIYYGNDDNDAYANNTTGLGYQARESLELKIRYADEIGYDSAAMLANADGSYNADGLWLETYDTYFGDGQIVTFEEAGIEVPSTSAAAKDGTGDALVKGFIHIPENYDELDKIPVVFTEQGQGIVYWKLPDGTNNFGTSAKFDATMTSWIGKDVIVVHIEDRSTTGTNLGEVKDCYDFVADDVAVMKAVLDKYEKADPEKIIIHGNSRGTYASNNIIEALAGCEYSLPWGGTAKLDKSLYDFTIDTYLCNNGDFGRGMMGTVWDEDDLKVIAATGMRAWIFDGQQDTDNIERRLLYVNALKGAGYNDAWIEENVRLSGYPSEIYYHWGESDHSTTRVNYWYFADEPFWGPDVKVSEDGELVYGTKLSKGDTYKLDSADMGSNTDGPKDGHLYMIYGDAVEPWALLDADSLQVAKVKAFVSRLYEDFLGRVPEEEGLNAWTEALITGRGTVAKVVYGFVYSPEFLNSPLSNEGFVTALYHTILGREPDASGLEAWVDVLDNGLTRKKVLEGFLNSKELRNIAADLGVEAGYYYSDEYVDQNVKKTMFVFRLYKIVFGRVPRTSELESWVKVLNDGKYTASDVVRGFFNSKENINRNLSPSDYVNYAYAAILGRDPDPMGLLDWTAIYRDEGSEAVIDGLLGSEEFKKMCDAYGVKP